MSRPLFDQNSASIAWKLDVLGKFYNFSEPPFPQMQKEGNSSNFIGLLGALIKIMCVKHLSIIGSANVCWRINDLARTSLSYYDIK